MSQRFVLGRENVPCIEEVVNRSLKADCTDFTYHFVSQLKGFNNPVAYSLKYKIGLLLSAKSNSCFI